MKQRLIAVLLVVSFLTGFFNSVLCLRADAAGSSAPSTTAAEVDSLFRPRSEGQHPRILANADEFTRIRQLIQKDVYMEIWYQRLYTACSAMLDEPLCIYELDYRGTLLEVCAEASNRITWLSMAYQLSGERRFADRAVQEMLNVSQFPDWHADRFHLDVSQMAYGVGIGYDWLYHYMSDSQRKTIRQALYNYAILTSMEEQWYQTVSANLNPWGQAGICVAAAAIYEEHPQECSSYLASSVKYIQKSLEVLAPSGAYPEGPLYYSQAMEFTVILFETLQSVLGTEFGLTEIDGVKEAGSYLLAMNGNIRSFSFGDGLPALSDAVVLHWFANRYHIPELSAFQRKSLQTDEFLALLWYNPELLKDDSGQNEIKDRLLYSNDSVSVAAFRSADEEMQQIYAAIKSGNNQSNHSDMDIGTFYLEALGQVWFEDLGRDDYGLPGYWDMGAKAKRWQYYRKRAEGQNVLVFNPDATGGQDYDAKAQIVSYESAYDGGYAVVDMLDAYDSYGVSAAKRGFLLFDDRSRILVRDEFTCTAASELYWFAHTSAEVSLSADRRTAELKLGQKTLLAQIAAPADAVFSVMEAEPLATSPKPEGEESRDGNRKLAIHMENITEGAISVVFTPIVKESDRNKPLPTASIGEFSSLLQNAAPSATLVPNVKGVYEIQDAEQLMLLAQAVHSGNSFAGKTVVLTKDIDLASRTFTPIGTDSVPFRGTFDGGNHVIRNLLIFEPESKGVGLFGNAKYGAIQNLGIESGMVFCQGSSGALVGNALTLRVENCYNKAKVIAGGSYNGGLIGTAAGTCSIQNCYNRGIVKSGGEAAGGIIGYICSKAMIDLSNCYHAGQLQDSKDYCGLVGFYHTTNESYLVGQIRVTNCYATQPLKCAAIADNSSLESYENSGQLSASQMVGAATSLGRGYIYDCEWENSGYPVLQWQCDTVLPADFCLRNAAQLRLLAYTVNSGIDNFGGKTICLTEDVDLDSREWIPIGGYTYDSDSTLIFKGTFDGRGHCIRNLRLSTDRNYAGFFGTVDGAILNLGIESGSITANKIVGGLVGYARGRIEQCYNRGAVTGNHCVGGLVGMSAQTHILNCYNNAPVTSQTIVGGIVGNYNSASFNAVMENCYHNGSLTGSMVGGLCGTIHDSVNSIRFLNCFAPEGTTPVSSSHSQAQMDCTLLPAGELRGSAAGLGDGFTTDNGIARNGGYPILNAFLYQFTQPPVLSKASDNSYLIRTAEELRILAYMVNVKGESFAGQTIRLCADLDLENREWIPIGGNIPEDGAIMPGFSGYFHGGGHVISNICIRSGNCFVGLFGRLISARIENVGIEGGMILGSEKVGAIAGGVSSGTTIRGCYNKASVSGAKIVGGLVGMFGGNNNTVHSCYNTGLVSASNAAGGIVGYIAGGAENSLLQNCYNTGTGSYGILGLCHETAISARVVNCATIDSVSLTQSPGPVTVTASGNVSASELRSYAVTLGDAFAEDFFSRNRIFPVLAWENGDRSSVLQQVDGVYQITCADDLRLLSYLVRKGNSFYARKIELTCDIDLENKPWLSIGGCDETNTYHFRGSFNGRGHIIRNLFAREWNDGYSGLFGSVAGGVIENIGIESGSVLGDRQVAGVAGNILSGTRISSCYNKAFVYGNVSGGGIVAMAGGTGCTIEDCYNTGHIESRGSYSFTAGIVGYLSSGAKQTRIQNCYNTGNHYGIVNTVHPSAQDNTVENCYSAKSRDITKSPADASIQSTAQLSSNVLKGYASVLGDAFDDDKTQQNMGYPVLTWESGKLCFHQYTVVSNGSPDYHLLMCNRCGYSKTEAHSLSNVNCICGDSLREPIVNESFKIYHSLDLASDISVNYVVPKSLLADFDMDTVYMTVETDEYEGNVLIEPNSYKLYPVEKGEYYYFTLNSLSAVEMNNELRAVLYGQKGLQPYYSERDTYSIASYAYSQLGKNSAKVELKTLCADLLRYGSGAQSYKAYHTDNLADAAMTEEQKAYLSDAESVSFGNHSAEFDDLAQPQVKWIGNALDLSTRVGVKYVIDLDSFTGNKADLSLKVRYETITGEQTTVILTEQSPYGPNGEYSSFILEELQASELRTVLTAAVYEKDTQVSNTINYSADTYGNGKSGILLTLCKALFAYSDSARAYFIS